MHDFATVSEFAGFTFGIIMCVTWIGDVTSDLTSQHYLYYSEAWTAVVKVVPCLVAAVLAHPGTNHKFFLRVRALDCSNC